MCMCWGRRLPWVRAWETLRYLLTSVQRREAIQCRIILLDGFGEVVGREGVLAQLVVDTGDVVEVEGTQALSCISDDGRLGGRAQHLQSFAVVLAKKLHIGLKELCTGRLWVCVNSARHVKNVNLVCNNRTV